jgi:hypothetical protein
MKIRIPNKFEIDVVINDLNPEEVSKIIWESKNPFQDAFEWGYKYALQHIIEDRYSLKKRTINGYKPDFVFKEIPFFEIKKWWGISRICHIDNKFKGQKIIGFITHVDFNMDHATETRLMDWMIGFKRPLILIENNHVYVASWDKENESFKFTTSTSFLNEI